MTSVSSDLGISSIPRTSLNRMVSVVICTRNRCQDLRATLKALGQVKVLPGVDFELLIVDNGSTDDTRKVVESTSAGAIPITYCFEAQPGLSNARNTAVAHARGEVLLFTDDDVRPPENWLEQMCSPILLGKAQAVAGGVQMAPHLERPWMVLLHRGLLASSEYINPAEPQHLIGANMAFSRQVLSAVPAFDPELGAGALGFAEEYLFSHQLREANLRIAGALDCRVVHFFDESRLLRSSWLGTARKYGQTEAYLLYHWRHESISAPLLRYGIALAKIARRHIISRQDVRRTEGCAHWELSLLVEIAKYRQYLVERRRPRNYEKQGLKKLRGVMPATGRSVDSARRMVV